ncbi:proteasome assembly chaperone 1 [Anopheles ziemanni]|uniref:proteasome assembly chaperone 1 n=1 Tax=Anopheles coustani TaxID=139045 RepID=UPI002659EA58|nr:proteasome assembly chaperone 1 [Anopheles coustani]XP_058172934.1 proteasome assembly chaperone 1 [Anopheles ziemanni]
MSLNFGEIVEPSTRAFWDDYDEQEESDSPANVVLEWLCLNGQDHASEEAAIQKTLQEPFRFVILEGQKISSFVTTAILRGSTSLAFQLSCGTVNVFHLPAEKLLVCVSEEIEPNLFGSVTEKLSRWLEATESVITISLLPAVMYKGASEREQEQVCFIKALNKNVSLADIGQLEAPNVITGVAGGAVSYRKFLGKDAAAYACFLDSVELDSVSSEPILRLLKALRVPCADRYERKFKTSSNLYM